LDSRSTADTTSPGAKMLAQPKAGQIKNGLLIEAAFHHKRRGVIDQLFKSLKH